jgi:DNA ligase-1
MKSVYDTIIACRNESSRNKKIEILKAQAGNDLLKRYLQVTYENRINFYMKNVDTAMNTTNNVDITEFDSDMIDKIMYVVAGRGLTGNAAKMFVSNIYQGLTYDWEKELLRLMINRDVQAGFSASTINKIWPSLVTQVPYMRCSLPKHTKLETWPWDKGIYSQIKADGMFANITHQLDGAVTIESRSGSPFPVEFFSGIANKIKSCVQIGMQLHGELLMTKDGQILPRQIGNGLFNKILQDGEVDSSYIPIFQAWDCIPIEEATVKNKYRVSYSIRFESLKEMIQSEHTLNDAVELIEYKMVYSLAEAYKHAGESMQAGLEGTVIKHPDLIWEDSDGSEHQIKLKLSMELDLLFVGFKEADQKSKNANTFGSLMLQSSCGKMKVNVSGIKDAERERLHKELVAGKSIISVIANGVMMPPEHGGYFSLFLPRYTEERRDKSTADSLERILEIQTESINLAGKV